VNSFPFPTTKIDVFVNGLPFPTTRFDDIVRGPQSRPSLRNKFLH
jgi:hypothetical protein